MMGSVQGWLKPMLDRIEVTNQPRPEGGNVLAIPNGSEKLRKAIVHVQREEGNCLQEREDFEAAWRAASLEFQAAMEKNTVWHNDIQQRLYRLRCEWLAITDELGIHAQIKPPMAAQPATPPMQGDERA